MYTGIIHTLKTIFRQEGFTALWKGNIPAELLYLTYGAAQFLAFRQINVLLSDASKTTAKLPDEVKSFIAGSTAGAMATTATYPFDLLRTRFAAQGAGEKVYRSIAVSIRDIYTQEGLGGFYRGLGAGLGQIVPNMGLFFGTYSTVHNILREPVVADLLPTPPTSGGWEDAASGAVGSVVAKTGVFPLDLIRKRLQVQGPTKTKYVNGIYLPDYKGGVVKTGLLIMKNEGFLGLYRGLTVALIKAVPASAVTMWTYGQVLKLLEEWDEAAGRS
ncbi:putative mitochondrial deoxynucleotide carrier protein [Ascobolus immersus RN42]|uniref:Mitochondrial thiamine pyrophosphate carrier 1 n=1 Tax=Ascobolus immersus RN42 TaxID=1160509 RepID=A0A3N4I947_ASCIM|nr:putative mitochondrial deoxynucleotide carrier protein [Ascobolus immersus RN42]